MTEFLTRLYEAAFSLPTEPFTWLMMPVTLYWILSLSGIFSLEWLDGADGALDGAVDGAGEGLAESLGDGVAESLGEGAVDALAAGDALDAADGVVDAKAHALEAHGSGLAFHEKAGLGDVPRTFSWSLMVIFSWIFSLSGTLFIPGFQELATKGLWVALILAAASFGLAMMATAAAMKPIQRAMSAGAGTRSNELVGQTCTIRTQRVDQQFGQAEVDDGAMVIQVRSKDPTLSFPFGSKAVIYQYVPERSVYLVTPLANELTD